MKRIVEGHGGTVTFESSLGAGSRFATGCRRRRGRRGVTVPVLLVDDNDGFLHVVRTILEDAAAFAVWTVRSGAEALAFLARRPPFGDAPRPACVLLDFHLPDLDAPAVLRAMAAGGGLEDVPVLVLSQADWDEDERAALAAGATRFVVKPSRVQDLRRAVLTFCEEYGRERRRLLIEDSAETCRLIASALPPTEFTLAVVRTGRAGLAHLAAHPMDCVLLDYRLPDGDGLACLRDIRLHHPATAVIVVTGEGSEEVAVEAMKLGARDYLVKQGKWLLTVPVKVREALGRRHLEVMAARMQSELQSARGELRRLQQALVERYRLDGSSATARRSRSLRQAECAARSTATVILEARPAPSRSCSRAPSMATVRARARPSGRPAPPFGGAARGRALRHVRGAVPRGPRPPRPVRRDRRRTSSSTR